MERFTLGQTHLLQIGELAPGLIPGASDVELSLYCDPHYHELLTERDHGVAHGSHSNVALVLFWVQGP